MLLILIKFLWFGTILADWIMRNATIYWSRYCYSLHVTFGVKENILSINALKIVPSSNCFGLEFDS